MTILFGPFLCTALLAQAPADRTITGEVVDGRGKAVADAQVVLYAPPALYGSTDPVEARAKSDAGGSFAIKVPPLGVGRSFRNWANVLAYRPGSAIGAVLISGPPPFRLVLQDAQPRTIRIEGHGGEPIMGARVALRRLHVFSGTLAEVPDALADSLAVHTGPDGKATIGYVAARDQLVAVRVTADAIGSQDFLLVEQPGRSSEPGMISIRLKTTGRFVGRVVSRDDQGVADQPLEIWARGSGDLLPPYLVRFKGDQPRTDKDGKFQTADNLIFGSAYRVALRPPGRPPSVSDWITVQAKTQTVPPLVLGALRTIRGRVVDRHGNPVSNALVFQTGDGPERTSIRTGTDGRFALRGFDAGQVFVFARRDGFRFQGQLVKEAGRDVNVELTRTSEQPAREMRMLADPIPIEESRALARRLIEPCWNAVADKGDDAAKYRVLAAMVPADPAGALERLERTKFKDEHARFRLLRDLVSALAESDFEEAAAVAESIADPGTRSSALIYLADLLPAPERQRKLALLDRAVQQATIATALTDKLKGIGDVADRWFEAGEIERAKGLFAEGLKIASQLPDKTDSSRSAFAARLARVDLPAALAIAKDFAGQRWESRVLGNIAYRLALQNPAESERIWCLTRRMGRLGRTDSTLAWKLGGIDPARARRALEGMPWLDQRPELFIYLALGAKTHNESAARQSLETGMQGIDRMLRERPERYLIIGGSLLPVVERIDPALVPEMLWRAVASRTPAVDPRISRGSIAGRLIAELAWYDREVAAALFEPTRVRMEQTTDPDLASSRYDFLTWSLFDPRAAVARLEQTPINPDLAQLARNARLLVAASLGRKHEARWSEIFSDSNFIQSGTQHDF
jgi:hypothetical protein